MPEISQSRTQPSGFLVSGATPKSRRTLGTRMKWAGKNEEFQARHQCLREWAHAQESNRINMFFDAGCSLGDVGEHSKSL